MNSVDMIDANASENAVQRVTSMKMSQTWFASQTGPIAQSISPRARRPRSLPPDDEGPEAAPEVGPAEDRVERHPDPEHAGDCVGGAHSGASGRGGPYGTSTSSPSASRQRADIARSTMIVAVPSSA